MSVYGVTHDFPQDIVERMGIKRIHEDTLGFLRHLKPELIEDTIQVTGFWIDVEDGDEIIKIYRVMASAALAS